MCCIFLEEKNTTNFRILNSPILEPYNKKTVWNNKIYNKYMLLQNLDTLEENSLSNLCKERKTELWIDKALISHLHISHSGPENLRSGIKGDI